MENREQLKSLKTHQPCPSCNSSDALTINADGSTKCYSCDTFTPNKNTTQPKDEPPEFLNINKEIVKGGKLNEKLRGIEPRMFEFYDVTVGYSEDGKVSQVFFPYHSSKTDEAVASKMRDMNNKKMMPFSGEATKADMLFGQHKFLNKKGKAIFITEGEFDCLALRQVIDRPVVSLKNGTGGVEKDIRNNYEFLDGFEKIYVCFDNDKPGREATQKALELLPSGKAMISQAIQPECKDVNDYLLKGYEGDILQDFWWSAKEHTPDGIVSDPNRIWEAVTQEKNKEGGIPYPWETLNKLLFGIRLGEVTTICAGTGVGKSQVFRELQHHLFKSTEDNIGLFMLEETIGKTSLGLMSVEASLPLHLPTTEVAEGELKTIFDKVIAPERFHFYEGFKSFAVDKIRSCIEFLVKAKQCRYIFLDHISIMVSEGVQGDERKELDRIITILAQLAVEFNVHIFVISHLRRNTAKPHEEGGVTSIQDLRGTQAIGQLSFTILGLERNQQADTEEERNTTRIRVLKNRFSGDTGLATHLAYNRDTGRLSEVTDLPWEMDADNQDVDSMFKDETNNL